MELVFDYSSGTSSGVQVDLLACYQAFLGHELPNQLVPIQAFARLLSSRAEGLDDEGKVLLTRLAQLTRNLDALTRRLADVGRLVREPTGPSFSVNDLVSEAIASVRLGQQPRNLVARITFATAVAEPSPMVSRRLLLTVLVELLRNSTQALGDTPGQISVSTSSSASHWILTVSDTGKGFPPQGATLLQPFAAGRFPGASGPGLGLFLVRLAVAAWGGRLRIRSFPSELTTVEMFLPSFSPVILPIEEPIDRASPGVDHG